MGAAGRLRSASSNKKFNAASADDGQAAWEAATAKARSNRAPSHQPAANRSTGATKQSQAQLNKRSAVTASQGFGPESKAGKLGVSALNSSAPN